MGCSSGKRRTRGSTERSIARTSYRWKAPRIVSTPKPFTGFGCTRSRPERTPCDRLRGRCKGAGGRQGCQRLDRIGVDHGEIRRGEETPRRTVSESGRSERGRRETSAPPVSPRPRKWMGSGSGEPKARVQVVRWKWWQKSVGRIAVVQRKTVARPSLKEIFRAC